MTQESAIILINGLPVDQSAFKNKDWEPTTTDAYQTTVMMFEPYSKLLIQIIETGVSSYNIKFKIDASNDRSNWENLKSETTLAADSQTFETLTDAWRYIRLQAKSGTASSHTTVKFIVSFKSR